MCLWLVPSHIMCLEFKHGIDSAHRLLPADMHERWPQVCRVKINFTLLLTKSFVSTTTISMRCLVNWIPLRIRIRSRRTQPHLKVMPIPNVCTEKTVQTYGFLVNQIGLSSIMSNAF